MARKIESKTTKRIISGLMLVIFLFASSLAWVVEVIKADTQVKTWSFTGSAEGLSDAGNSSVVGFAHQATDNAVQFTTTNKNLTGVIEYGRNSSTGETWETWGVPAGATVTGIQVTAWTEKLVANTKLSSHTIDMRVIGSGGTSVTSGAGDLISASLGTTVDSSYQAGAAGSSRAVDAGSQASTTDVRLELQYTVTTSGGGGSANVDQRFDSIELTITYTPASATFTQNHYRWYVDSDSENVTDPWSTSLDLAEDTALTPLPFANDPPSSSQELRLRVNITVNSSTIGANERYFKLQHRTGTDSDCSTGSWTDVGTGAWVYATSSVTDDTTLTAAKLTGTDRLETYSKSKPAQQPTATSAAGEDIEFDFHIVGTSAATATRYLFRVVETTSDGTGTTALAAWTNCPVLHTEPGIDNFLRHGEFFSGESEQGFFWVD